jgi:hypothetical protein
MTQAHGGLPRLRHDPLPERVLVRGLTEKAWRGQAAASSGPPVPFVVGIERAAGAVALRAERIAPVAQRLIGELLVAHERLAARSHHIEEQPLFHRDRREFVDVVSGRTKIVDCAPRQSTI